MFLTLVIRRFHARLKDGQSQETIDFFLEFLRLGGKICSMDTRNAYDEAIVDSLPSLYEIRTALQGSSIYEVPCKVVNLIMILP